MSRCLYCGDANHSGFDHVPGCPIAGKGGKPFGDRAYLSAVRAYERGYSIANSPFCTDLVNIESLGHEIYKESFILGFQRRREEIRQCERLRTYVPSTSR